MWNNEKQLAALKTLLFAYFQIFEYEAVTAPQNAYGREFFLTVLSEYRGAIERSLNWDTIEERICDVYYLCYMINLRLPNEREEEWLQFCAIASLATKKRLQGHDWKEEQPPKFT